MADTKTSSSPQDFPTFVYVLFILTYMSTISLFYRVRGRTPPERYVERTVYAGFALSSVAAWVIMLVLLYFKPSGWTPSILKMIGVHKMGIMLVNAALSIWKEGQTRQRRDAEAEKA